MKIPRLVVATAAIALLGLPAAAQLLPGKPAISLGPLGGSANSVVVNSQNPSEVLIIKYTKGLFRSLDGGATFAPLSGISQFALDLTLDPKDNHTLYALDDKQVVRSTDFGTNWTPLALYSNEPLKGIAIASSGNGLIAIDDFDLYRSLDGGATWSTTFSVVPFAGKVLESIAYAPSDSSVAYLGMLKDVLKSTDGGATFTDPGPLSEWAQAITVSPTNPDIVFIGTPFNGVQRSMDGGATFTVVGTGPITGGSAQFFYWDPSGTRLWYAVLDGIAYTDNLGNTWTDAMAGFPVNQPIPLAMAADWQGGRFLGTEGGGLHDKSGGGLYHMPSGATAWKHIGFLEATINAVAIVGPGGKRVIGIGSGVYAGVPGVAPTPTAWHWDFGADTRAVAVDPTNPDRWVTGGLGAFFDNAHIVVVTQDGTQYAKTFEKYGGGYVGTIEFDPHVPGRVLAGMYMTGSSQSGSTPSILRSTNAGDSWVEVAGTTSWESRAIAFDPHTPGRVLQLSEDGQWSESVDGGQSWLPLQGTWPAGGDSVLLAFDPFLPGVLYKGDTVSGLMRSDDGGVLWTPLGVTLHDGSDLELHPQFPGMLWVSDASGKVLLSPDRGATFVELWDVHLNALGSALALDTADGSLLVGTAGEPLLGTPGASTWEIPVASPFVRLGAGTPGSGGFVPRHLPSGGLPTLGNANFAITGEDLLGGTTVFLGVGLSELSLPLFGGTLFVGPPVAFTTALSSGGTPGVGGSGSFVQPLPVPSNPSGFGIEVITQYAVFDPGAADPSLFALSPGLRITVIP